MSYHRETLVAQLRDRGITYLAPSDAKAIEVINSDEELIVALLQASDNRLQLALIPLFLRHPNLAGVLAVLMDEVPRSQAFELQTLYMAAVYLQRMWLTRLRFYLKDTVLLPDLYSDQLDLPPADKRFGKVGLYALADLWAARSPYPFNRLASLNKTIELFLSNFSVNSKH